MGRGISFLEQWFDIEMETAIRSIYCLKREWLTCLCECVLIHEGGLEEFPKHRLLHFSGVLRKEQGEKMMI
jgi:hypothetical protein